MDIENLIRAAGDKNLPLLQYTLKISDSGLTIPEGYDAKIRELRRMIAVRNIFLFEELKKILQSFNEAGIEAIVLKGVMMEGIYPPGVRVFGDMDILIRKKKLNRVIVELKKLNYQHYAPLLRPGAEVFQGALCYIKNVPYPIAVEPHWTLGFLYPYSIRIPIDDLWKRAQKTQIAGVETLILSPEDSLLHFCLHLLQHNHQELIHPACDIAVLVHHYQDTLDWKVFVKRVFTYDLCLPVKYSLRKTRDLFNCPIPLFVFERLDSWTPGRLEAVWFRLCVKSSGEEHRYVRALAGYLAIPLPLLPRYLWYKIFPCREFLYHRYPELGSKPLIYYHLYRMWDMAVKGLKALGDLIFRKG